MKRLKHIKVDPYVENPTMLRSPTRGVRGDLGDPGTGDLGTVSPNAVNTSLRMFSASSSLLSESENISSVDLVTSFESQEYNMWRRAAYLLENVLLQWGQDGGASVVVDVEHAFEVEQVPEYWQTFLS